ncbi:alpha-amylase family glycosyl hydrolase [Pontibacter beigongshangensis]|uniref:alpha-amylase family glycosyl hydrolase n=1 Tax=Pontibacter beigongshangensis TaxID=2574733 RepID=UPI001650C8EA|nr:alpha-amylase family glycosyl hydrolase [Pontibacter beigongshangensis]
MNTTRPAWATEATFYHIYPLGLSGASLQNDLSSSPIPRLASLKHWVNHLSSLGCDALYLGPLFEAGTHGYDTVDYYTVDRRLGTNSTLAEVVAHFHAHGIRVVLDGVFNHVGRDFWAFKNLQADGESSSFRHWFAGVDFSRRSPYGDAFVYEGWNGHYNLIKLNLQHPEVRAHLFEAVKMWVQEFGIDGLRLDAADVMDHDFLRDLASYCRSLRSDFWLMGEVIHGDYRRWANPGMLHSTTNYECYKGLYSSHNDRNYFELAFSLNRLFGAQGIYKDLSLYNFADNHDVNRIASTLRNPAHLYPLHALLFTMPGIPSVYYGSEWGISGTKLPHTDAPLRPAIASPDAIGQAPHPELATAIRQFAGIRKQSSALRQGTYEQVFVAHEQFAFARRSAHDHVLVAVNAADAPAKLLLTVDLPDGSLFTNLLDQQQYRVQHKTLPIEHLPAHWACILQQQ